ncbi:MAG: hypothetical protein RL318_92 [Fibrobacterota bacterium]|jgi:NAD+--dinitrogen-reductase ADP-D-ribosyltransferase
MSSDATSLSSSITNRCSLPPWALASCEFQDNPWPIEIIGVKDAERRLFEQLETIETPDGRGQHFHDYLSKRFLLDQFDAAVPDSPGRHNYIRFLRDWGADSNRRGGAVLKAWVESRFGLRPTYHAGILRNNPEAQERYVRDRMNGETVTMGITMQLDLLYTFCQYELARRFPAERWKTLYRGTYNPEEYTPASGDKSLIELNNLSSFTSNREVAWEFGSSVWEVKIPIPKIVFFPGLLPRSLLQGEQEHLVLGGQYRYRKLAW